MRIEAVTLLTADVPLARPYAIANATTDAVSMVRVSLRTDGGSVGLGTATPEPRVTGETFAAIAARLDATGVVKTGLRVEG